MELGYALRGTGGTSTAHIALAVADFPLRATPLKNTQVLSSFSIL